MKILAGIVTFNPDINRLKQNIASLINQVNEVILVDNSETESDFDLDNNIKIIKNKKNLGIAKALNQIMEYASDHNYQWVITLDQDSLCPKDYINKANKYFLDKEIGQITPLLYESKAGECCYLGNKKTNEEISYLNKSITSGTINNVEVWKEINGYDEDLFIDYVDYDYAFKLIKNNYKIIRLNNVILDHQIGNSVLRKIGPFKIRVANHNAQRKYYIARNIVIFKKRYHSFNVVTSESLRLLKVILLTILFEDNKKEKLKAINKGIKDGIKY